MEAIDTTCNQSPEWGAEADWSLALSIPLWAAESRAVTDAYKNWHVPCFLNALG